MKTNDILWQAKLLAWVHDPAEKALVLFRDPAGHEGGTVAELRRQLFPEGIPTELQEIVKRADHWAAAADRPQFPRVSGGGPFETWAQVRFDKEPVLVHPLSGDKLKMVDLGDVVPAHLKAISLDHFKKLMVRSDQVVDWQKTALSFWRFGPESPARELGYLWSLLPADTRVPDHTIWAHLDLSSAFCGAFISDPNKTPALLVVSIGPVQGFIAQSRTTSDLWAGSHLLSMISWEAMKVVCEKFGTDSVVFPQLRGIPVVDLWLHLEMGLPIELWLKPQWKERVSDANPLFSAALPNKFVAVIPSAYARELAEEIEARTRQWVKERSREAIDMLLDETREEKRDDLPCYGQIEKQLAEFPEVHWAAVPWSLVSEKGGLVDRTDELAEAMRAFYPKGVESPGFLGTSLWKLLSASGRRTARSFFKPNPGILYPAIYDLVDRLLGATKCVRPFDQIPQHGFRCSLCGERECMCLDRNDLQLSPGERTATLWAKVGRNRPAWARKSEHLCSICTLKRLWPSMFVGWLKDKLSLQMGRYVVSTHTMALATTFDRWLSELREKKLEGKKGRVFERLSSHVNREDTDRAALPRSLHRKLEQLPNEMEEIRDFTYRLPTFLDDLREKAHEIDNERKGEGEKQLREIENILGELFGQRPEAYYGLILMDGDNMGKWLSGDRSLALKNREVWHCNIVKNLNAEIEDSELKDYIEDSRPMSPARHTAISAALNAFSADFARYVVEDLFKGKLLYSGGDDLLAMISVDDLLPAMFLLRLAYSGIGMHNKNKKDDEDEVDLFMRWFGLGEVKGFRARKGHIRFGNRLYRVMGGKATASFGAVVAHHTAPLGGVLRELRRAEHRAKNEGGRDAFSISIMKRAGGRVHLTLPWDINGRAGEDLKRTPMGVLISWRNALADKDMSRRAAYIIQDWVLKLPPLDMLGKKEAFKEMLSKNMEYQLGRQWKGSPRYGFLGSQLAEIALNAKPRSGKKDEKDVIHAFLIVAEFFAREGRLKLENEEDRKDG